MESKATHNINLASNSYLRLPSEIYSSKEGNNLPRTRLPEGKHSHTLVYRPVRENNQHYGLSSKPAALRALQAKGKRPNTK
jgi:hypothetical protein